MSGERAANIFSGDVVKVERTRLAIRRLSLRVGFLLYESEVQMTHDRKYALEHTDNAFPVI